MSKTKVETSDTSGAKVSASKAGLPEVSQPDAGARPRRSNAGNPTVGARPQAGKDSTNEKDSHRLGNRPAAWSRKNASAHADEKQSKKER